MKELLKVYSVKGEVVLERELSDEKGPLLISMGEKIKLSATANEGEKIVGALVRDDDGWTLASNDITKTISSGPKVASSVHLLAGVACALDGLVFRLERAEAMAGSVLIWKTSKTKIAADRLIHGCNILAQSPSGSSYEVNPAVIGNEVFEIFPTNDGADIVVPGVQAQRLSIPKNTLFSVGEIKAMVMDAADAAKAVKSGSPFTYPARGTRSAMLFALILLALGGLYSAQLHKELSILKANLAVDRGAKSVKVETESRVATAVDEDVLIYQLSFFRSLPLILQPKPNHVTDECIRRGEEIAVNEEIKREVQFLKDVSAIQNAIQKSDWVTLKSVLEHCDKKMFITCEAEGFYKDASAVERLVNESLPRLMTIASERGSKDFEESKRLIDKAFEDLNDNIFMSDEVVKREGDIAKSRWRALSAYVPARESYLSNRKDLGDALIENWPEFLNAFDPEESAFAAMIEKDRDQITEEVLKRAQSAGAVELIKLCELGDQLGLDEKMIGDWRKRAKDAKVVLGKKYRELYSDYRARAAVAPDAPETLAILDEMISIGLTDNRFHLWAEREKERISSK